MRKLWKPKKETNMRDTIDELLLQLQKHIPSLCTCLKLNTVIKDYLISKENKKTAETQNIYYCLIETTSEN